MVSVGGFDCKEQVQPQSNMVLRKRIRRIRQGMKKYNDQLVEVKRELKSCKTKMEAQTKQVHEYSSRLEEYDKKFEENSRKFQTLLTVSNQITFNLLIMPIFGNQCMCHVCNTLASICIFSN